MDHLVVVRLPIHVIILGVFVHAAAQGLIEIHTAGQASSATRPFDDGG
ncbi:hypothetical protein Psta_1871 [Pirellula staleyi DSM 6068]|uniref:Uncharacterized protein n=1 Tax=Pirellula staleyi (strain ATCC 27377 / DSM 6068 / ICPB 4128) TaxID=530564 RepID=D2QZR2_PIRSD|nr:hypothetical protein Psta_1871 [Pirellula staleyi DSM 6068]